MTWNDVTRSTEEEHKEFRRMLDNLMLTPEKLNAHIQRMINEQKKKVQGETAQEDRKID